MSEQRHSDKIDTIRIPCQGERWKHFKGSVYRVVRLAKCTSSGRDLVVYESVKPGGGIWVRPLSDWLQVITLKEDQTCPRFEPVEEPERDEFVDSKPAGRPIEERGPEY